MLIFRNAEENDLPDVIALLSGDLIANNRENTSAEALDLYKDAFQQIKKQQGNQVIVCESNKVIIAVLQLTFIPCLARMGAKRAQIEGVRVHKDYQKQGIGAKIFYHAIELSKKENCTLVQLTTDNQRLEAYQFYKKLGFIDSHIGMKLYL